MCHLSLPNPHLPSPSANHHARISRFIEKPLDNLRKFLRGHSRKMNLTLRGREVIEIFDDEIDVDTAEIVGHGQLDADQNADALAPIDGVMNPIRHNSGFDSVTHQLVTRPYGGPSKAGETRAAHRLVDDYQANKRVKLDPTQAAGIRLNGHEVRYDNLPSLQYPLSF